MADVYQIFVSNNSPNPQAMFFFQQPAVYTASGGEANVVYSNCLASQQIAAKPDSGSEQIQFTADIQLYAGIQTQSSSLLIVEMVNSSVIAEVPIEVASPSDQDAANMTTMSIEPALALSAPVNDGEIEDGIFRIVTPSFSPESIYNAGVAAIAQQNVMLSNYVIAPPNQNLDVQPVAKFYVATGIYTAGMIIDFSSVSANAAVCDATNGQENFQVIYEANGTWTVN